MRFNKKVLFIAAYIAIGIIAGFIITANLDFYPQPKATAENNDSQAPAQLELNLIENEFIKISEEVGPSVVSISTVQMKAYESPFKDNPFGDDDFFNKFFGDFFKDTPQQEYKQQGLGSGVIIDAKGHILTNEHVIADADEVTVTLTDGREYKAEIKGTDPRSDLAVIKIKAEDLQAAKLGDSSLVKTGQWSIAIGNPYGYYLRSSQPTVTVGVISALHRQLPTVSRGQRLYTDLIQTDAAINPGNSGGPLVNLNGEVIGINVAIFSSTGGYQGLGFAIPINTAKYILNELIKGEEIEYSWLGVTVQDVTKDLAEFFKMEEKQGALVIDVFPKGPADEAGIKPDDIIIAFDGKKVKNHNDLINMVSHTKVGKTLKIKIIRNAEEISLKVTTGKRPDEVGLAGRPQQNQSKKFKGIEVADITEELADKYGLKANKGVLVIKVDKNSSTYWAGLREGDIIYAVNKKPVNSVEDFDKVTADIKRGEAVFLRTNRGYISIKSND
jgi:serine protease Do